MSASGEARVPTVRVMIVNYNSGPWLQRCLDALSRQSWRDFEAVIVDNASQDDSLPAAMPDPRFTLLRQTQNLGFAAANNVAARMATTEWLVLLNPDAVASPDWLEALLAEARAHPDCAILGSTQLRADDPEVLDGTGDCLSAYGLSWRSGYGHSSRSPLPEGEVFAACGAAMMIRRELFEQLGGFETRFFCYVEDVDLCFRARLRGERIWQSSRAVVSHASGACSEPGGGAFAMYHGYRNSVWLLVRCMPMPWLLVSLSSLLGYYLLRIARPRRAGQRIALWRGLRAACSQWRSTWTERVQIQQTRTMGRLQVAAWLSWNPRDTRHRRCVLLHTDKKNARH